MAVSGRSVYKYQVALGNDRQTWVADEPVNDGGTDLGPTPVDLLLSALAGCKVITARMYADRKAWPVEQIAITVTHDRVKGENGMVDQIDCEMTFEGELSAEQRDRLLQIANKCPVHRMLKGDTVITSQLVGA